MELCRERISRSQYLTASVGQWIREAGMGKQSINNVLPQAFPTQMKLLSAARLEHARTYRHLTGMEARLFSNCISL